MSTEQQNVVVNPEINCVFFESQNLCYNYKTNRFTRIPGFDGQGYFSISNKNGVIGQIVFSGTSVDFQTSENGVALDALIETGDTDPNAEGRWVTTGIRPLINESANTAVKVRVGTRDTISASVDFTSTTAPSTVNGVANLRTEGRYHRLEVEIEGGFDTALGADFEGYNQGNR